MADGKGGGSNVFLAAVIAVLLIAVVALTFGVLSGRMGQSAEINIEAPDIPSAG
jgi:hypothetical protein